MLDVADGGLNSFSTDRALFQGTQKPCAQFALVEGLPCAVLFDNAGHDQFGHFVGSKAFVARETLAPPTHLVTLGYEPGVNDFGVFSGAEWAVHGRASR